MLKNYFKIALRSLARHKLFSFINIFGLALSMSVCMIVMLRLKDQLSYDNFHPNAGRIVRVLSEVQNKKGDKFTMATTPLPLKQYIDKSIAEDAVQIYPAVHEKAATETKSIHVNGAFTDASFFHIFGFTLEAGNKQTALSNPNSIVLSSETAEKFFGSENAIGKVLSFEKLGNFIVTGVLAKQGKSHINYDAYLSVAGAADVSNWNSFDKAYTYVLLKKNASARQLENSLSQISNDGSFTFSTQPLNDITPSGKDLMNDMNGGGSWGKLWAEISIALIILVAACFNYTNLTIARALSRAKEVGIRKISGAVRSQVFAQYIIESVVIALFALGLAHVFLQLILEFKPFNDGYEMVPVVTLDITIISLFILFAIVTGIIAGAAPAWILSAFKPVTVLKNISTQKLFGNITLQKTLIVFQFSLSLVVIIFLSAFYRQFSFLGTADNGFQTKNILTVSLNGVNPKLFSTLAANIAGVEHVAPLSTNFGRQATGTLYATTEKSVQPVQLDYYNADQELLAAMQLKLVAGNNFSSNSVLLNETAAAALKLKNPTGNFIWVNDSTQLRVAGVVKDFHYAGAGRMIRPMALLQNESGYSVLNISVAAANREQLLAQMKDAWNKTYPGHPFTYSWLDKELRDMNSQTASISLLGFLAFMTVTIACLGLLGLVIYTVETRTKEISIRKVIGAEVQQLMLLLSKGFIKLLLIAGLIAMPVGYVLSFIFLQAFANRIELGFGWLFLCFGSLLSIGLFTVLSQTYRASSVNPVKHLKNE